MNRQTLSAKIFSSHVIGHQRLSTAEEALNNQVERMICPVAVGQPLSLATQCLDNGFLNRMAVLAEMETKDGQNGRALSH